MVKTLKVSSAENVIKVLGLLNFLLFYIVPLNPYDSYNVILIKELLLEIFPFWKLLFIRFIWSPTIITM